MLTWDAVAVVVEAVFVEAVVDSLVEVEVGQVVCKR